MIIKRNIENQLFSFYFQEVLLQRDVVQTNRVLRYHFAKSMTMISDYIFNSFEFWNENAQNDNVFFTERKKRTFFEC